MKKSIMKTLVACSISATVLLTAAIPVQASAYTVKPGDSFWLIAKKENLDMNLLIATNPELDPMNLQVGRTVRFPHADARVQTKSAATTATTYVVQGHESFWDISRKLNISHPELVAANKHLNPRNLYDGLTIHLPNTAPASSALAASTQNQTVQTVNGQQISYKKAIQAKASAYTGSAEENGGWANLDYFGNQLKLGTIAVDPKVIPFNSKVYVTGYDFNGLPVGGLFGTATDTGGAIKGDRIDIFIPGKRSEVVKFGFQNVTVYVLE